ncbi:MAG: NAD(P)H-dependent oxidoreductase [Alphaproteobacteria bacterium]|jgi:glutathione-regulated potassium-efflux system ancillary protein KefG
MTASAVVLFAHPAEEGSRTGALMARRVEAMTSVTVRRLYDLYPDFDVHVQREKEVWDTADVIVLQHPFHWYSCPSLLREYLDVVLEHGWAYGKNGSALTGKSLQSVITTGGVESAYSASGHNKFTMTELLRPFEATANLCGMSYEPPLILHNANHVSSEVREDFLNAYENRLSSLLARHSAVAGKVA